MQTRGQLHDPLYRAKDSHIRLHDMMPVLLYIRACAIWNLRQRAQSNSAGRHEKALDIRQDDIANPLSVLTARSARIEQLCAHKQAIKPFFWSILDNRRPGMTLPDGRSLPNATLGFHVPRRDRNLDLDI